MASGNAHSHEAALRSLYQAYLATVRGAPDATQIRQAILAVAGGASTADVYWLRACLATLAKLMELVLPSPRLAAGERVAIFRFALPLLLSVRSGRTGRTILRRSVEQLRESEPSIDLPPLSQAQTLMNMAAPEKKLSSATMAEVLAMF